MIKKLSTRNNIIIAGAILILFLVIIYWFVQKNAVYPTSTVPTSLPAASPTVVLQNEDGSGQSSFTVKELLESANVIVPETDTPVSLVDGVGKFDAGGGPNSGTVTLGNVFSAVKTGENEYDLFGVIEANFGGSGTFAYIVIFQSSPSGLKNTDSEPLGDRIKVTGITASTGVLDPSTDSVSAPSYKVQVDYLGRSDSAPMAEEPNVPKTLYFPVASHKFAN